MSADLHLYVMQGNEVQNLWYHRLCNMEVEIFESLEKVGNFLGYEQWTRDMEAQRDLVFDHWSAPNIWIGQVSWLKAGLFEETERWIPGPIARISDLFQDCPVLTENLIKATLEALNQPDHSVYSRVEWLYDKPSVDANWAYGRRVRRGKFRCVRIKRRGINRDRRAVKKFLYQHIGKRISAESM